LPTHRRDAAAGKEEKAGRRRQPDLVRAVEPDAAAALAFETGISVRSRYRCDPTADGGGGR
jgi:hypothetical protein